MYKVGNIYVIAAIAIIGGGLFGFDISSQSAILGTWQYKCYFNDGDPNVPRDKCAGPTASNQGGISAAMPGGSWVGALVSGFLTDWFGRKKAIMISTIIWCIGSIITAASQNIGMLVAGRFINGLCVGIASAQVPVYIAELAPPSKRGRLVGAQQWAITWGILIMFYISYGCSFIQGTAAFRVPWALQMIPAIILFLGMLFLPESPRWLAKKERWDECNAVLTLVHGKGDPDSPFVARELADIRQQCEFERKNADVTYLDLFKPDMIWRTHIGVFMQIWSQLTGMNVMMYYIVYVFAMAGLQGNNLLVSSSIQYVINVVMTVPALLYVDRWGRRPTLLLGALGMMICMFTNAGLLASYGHYAGPNGVDNVQAVSWELTGAPAKALIAFTYLFVACFAPSFGPVSWIYPPELYPLRVRGKAVALATSSNWIFNFALTYFVPPAFVNIKWQVYIIFGVFNLAMFVHVLVAFPETAGKTLEEIEDMFTDPNGIKGVGTPAWKTRKSYGNARSLERSGSVAADGGEKGHMAATQHREHGSESESDKGVKV